MSSDPSLQGESITAGLASVPLAALAQQTGVGMEARMVMTIREMRLLGGM